MNEDYTLIYARSRIRKEIKMMEEAIDEGQVSDYLVGRLAGFKDALTLIGGER